MITSSPNMSLPVPVVGDEAGPQYAIDINACLAILDAHDHSSGSGVQITPSGLNINADLSIGSNNLTGIRSSRYSIQSAPLALAADLNCTYVTGVDLYYNDGLGNQIQITDNGGVAGTPGSIANLTSPASASYVAINETFVWQSDANEAANMDMRSAILRNSTASSFGLTLAPPTLAADVTQTLPQVPAASAFMTMASSGVMGTSVPLALGIQNSMIADDAIALRNMQDDSVDTAQLLDEAVTAEKLAAYNINNSGASLVVNSTSYTDVVSLSLTVSGVRPILVILNSYNNANNPGYISITDSVNPPVGIMAIQVETVGDVSIFEFASTSIGTTFTIPASLTAFTFPGAGTKNIKLKAKVLSGTTNLTFQNVQLTAYEL